MRVIHLLRKPLAAGTVASNILTHGCGGLNIAASRVGVESRSYRGSGVSQMRYTDGRAGLTDGRGRGMEFSVAGRWPGNLILQHLDGCRCDGIKKVKGQNPKYVNKGKGSKAKGIYGELPSRPAHTGIGHADEDGKETVADWVCAEGCPVKALDEQTGELGNNHRESKANGSSSIWGSGKASPTTAISDTGGASRFFKQVGGSEE